MGLFKLLLLIAIGLLIVGSYRGWYLIRRKRDEQTGKIKFEVSIDSDKARQDVEAVKQRAYRAVGSEAATDRLVEGTIVGIESQPDSIRVRSNDQTEFPVQISAQTTVRFANGPGTAGDLRIGDRAAIEVVSTDGQAHARAVVVGRER